MNSNFNIKLDKAMTAEQFTQVVDAILEGKYSWACVLILRFAGYNPLHYIPYRTYNRLMKENRAAVAGRREVEPHTASLSSETLVSHCHSHQIRDLNYLEPLRDSSTQIKGGKRSFWLTELHPK